MGKRSRSSGRNRTGENRFEHASMMIEVARREGLEERFCSILLRGPEGPWVLFSLNIRSLPYERGENPVHVLSGLLWSLFIQSRD
jgi:hypothetical protein